MRTCEYIYTNGRRCPYKHKGRGFCEMHYRRWRKGRDLDEPERADKKYCDTEGCDKEHHARGKCAKCYLKLPDSRSRSVLKNGRRRSRIKENQAFVRIDIRTHLLRVQQYCCANITCNEPIDTDTAHLDHIVPLSKSGTHEEHNLQMLCRRCNLSKGCKMPEDFEMQQITNYLLHDN